MEGKVIFKHFRYIILILAMLLAQPSFAQMNKEAHNLYQQACQYEYQRKFSDAIQKIYEALQIAGDDAILYTKLAGLYSDLGDYQNALAAYKKAIKLRPNDAFIYVSIGNILQNLGDYQNAYNSYMQALEIFPNYKYNYINVANVLYLQGDYKQAIEYYNLFLSAYPDHQDARETLANSYLRDNQTARACDEFNTVYAKFPTTFKDFEGYGFALFREKQYSAAVDILKQAIAQNPDNINARANLAVSYQELEKYDLAKKEFEDIFALKPDYTALRLFYANLLADMKLTKDAIVQYKLYLAAYPEDANAYNLIALAYKDDNQISLAIKNFEISLQKDNTNVEVKKELAQYFHANGEYANALKYYDEILKVDANNFDVKANKALALHALKSYESAIAIYTELLKIKDNERLRTNLVDALVSKGDVLLTKGEYRAAVSYFNRGIELNPNESYSYYGLAKAYENLLENDRAQEFYEKAIEADSENELYKSDYLAFKKANKPELLVKETPKALPKDTIKITAVPVNGESTTTMSQSIVDKSTQSPTQNNLPQLSNIDDLMISKTSEQIEDMVKVLIKEGDDFYKANDYEQALIKYQEALKYNPKDYLTTFKTANLLKMQNDNEKAISFYKKAISINKNYADAWFNMGLVYAANSDYKNCRDCFAKVIELNAEYPYAYYALALSFEKEGNSAKAIEYYQTYYGLEKDESTKRAVTNKINELQKTLNPSS